jgi:hypothetical protein
MGLPILTRYEDGLKVEMMNIMIVMMVVVAIKGDIQLNVCSKAQWGA